MISDIVSYFDARIKEVDSGLNRWEDPFGDDEVTDNVADSYYKLVFGDISSSIDGSVYVDEIDVTLEIYSTRQRDVVAGFEAAYEKAISIKDQIICPGNAKNEADFTDVFAQTITPSPLESSDNTTRITINFNVRRDNYFAPPA